MEMKKTTGEILENLRGMVSAGLDYCDSEYVKDAIAEIERLTKELCGERFAHRITDSGLKEHQELVRKIDDATAVHSDSVSRKINNLLDGFREGFRK